MTYYPNPAHEAYKASGAKPARVKLDCVHLGEATTGPNPRRMYLECEKGHGPQCACDKPQKCGPMCGDYEKSAGIVP
jgi:hypothetical protein